MARTIHFGSTIRGSSGYLILAPTIALATAALGHLMTLTTHAADVISTWNGSTGNWSDAARWSSANFPNNGNGGLTYDAIINSGTVTLDRDITIEALNVGGGLLTQAVTNSFTLTLNDLFTWTGGRLGGPGQINANDGIVLGGGVLGNGGNTGSTLVNNGVANFSGANLQIISSGGANPGSLLQNNGTFNATDEADIQSISSGGMEGRFVNAGTINKSGAGTNTLIGTLFNNTGTVNVNEGTLQVSGTFTNYNGTTETLAGGTWNITSTLRFTGGGININQASITLNGPASQIINHNAINTLSGFRTNDTGASFAILNNRNFTTTAAFTNRGQFQIGGGTFDAASITNAASGEFFGFGRIADAIANSGTVRAAGGTLVMGGIIDGQSGTIEIDSGASLDLSGAGGASDTDLLIHNGNDLNLGANNVLVRVDYENANFGVGNAFNPRANVTGSGQIMGAGVAQSLTGDVTGGTSNTATMQLGNIHVGDSITRNYRINNAGNATSARLRGAVQTTAGGGNLTDGRLSGAGVTAGNFGPIAGTANSGDLAVTFTGTSAGALAGQQVRIANNFDNVADQLLQFSGTVYRLAAAGPHTPEPVNFGIVHVGDTLQQALSVTNTVLNDGFSERLDASIGSPTGSATTNGGSFSALAPGATNNSSLVVGIDTSSAGAKSGTATITLTSNGAGTSGLPNTVLAPQTVNVQAQVNNFAVAEVRKVAGNGTLSMTAVNQFALNLGSIVEGQSPLMAELGVRNIAAAPADELAGSFTLAAPAFTLSVFNPFSGVAAGNTHGGLVVSLGSSAAGAFTGSITLAPRSTNARPFSMDLAPIIVQLIAEVEIAGDYNRDGTVDAADYVVWRKNLNQPTTPFSGSDGNGNGTIDNGDYSVWRSNFGRSSGVPAASTHFVGGPPPPLGGPTAAVPEALTGIMLLVGTAGLSSMRYSMRIHSRRVLHAPMMAAIAIVALTRLAAAQGHQYSFTLIADSQTFGGPVGGVVSINQGGLVAFAGNNGAGNGIFVGDGTFIDEVALDMNADPGSDYVNIEPITAINSMSEVAFMATEMPTTIGQPLLPGIYKGFPSSGAFTTIAEVDNTTIIQLVGPSSISPGGTVAFKARTLPENHWELMTSAGGGLASIANSAQNPLFAGLNSPIINNQGVVAFRGSDQNGQMHGIFKGPGLPIFISTPDGLTHPYNFDMNNGGRVAFSENTTTPMGSETRILTSANGMGYSVIADVGDPSAGVPAPYFGTGVAINDHGEVLFSATQPMFLSVVMYVSDGETMWRVEGDPFVNGVGAVVGARAMNNAGQIVFAIGDESFSQVWRADPLFAGLAGDYNRDDSVDAVDYVVWRKNDGTQAGYDLWRANFGKTVGSGAALPYAESLSAAVPEPRALWLALVAVGSCPRLRRRSFKSSRRLLVSRR